MIRPISQYPLTIAVLTAIQARSLATVEDLTILPVEHVEAGHRRIDLAALNPLTGGVVAVCLGAFRFFAMLSYSKIERGGRA